MRKPYSRGEEKKGRGKREIKEIFCRSILARGKKEASGGKKLRPCSQKEKINTKRGDI